MLAHIPYRTTRELDVLIQPTLNNATKAGRAVNAWGFVRDVQRLAALRSRRENE